MAMKRPPIKPLNPHVHAEIQRVRNLRIEAASAEVLETVQKYADELGLVVERIQPGQPLEVWWFSDKSRPGHMLLAYKPRFGLAIGFVTFDRTRVNTFGKALAAALLEREALTAAEKQGQ